MHSCAGSAILHIRQGSPSRTASPVAKTPLCQPRGSPKSEWRSCKIDCEHSVATASRETGNICIYTWIDAYPVHNYTAHVYVYTYACILCMHVCIYVYIYIYILYTQLIYMSCTWQSSLSQWLNNRAFNIVSTRGSFGKVLCRAPKGCSVALTSSGM